ncbi:MAG: M24 family metallopeptidase [Candidatus Peribacteraceae bacterium]|nr:M24 family metallopeptidase [Candidatus Peribacteraceae bacterium]
MRPTSPSQILKQANAPAFLITNLINIRYLTGLSVSAGVMLIVPRKMLLFVDSRYREMANALGDGITVKDLSELPAIMNDVRRCGFESEDVTVHRWNVWTKKFPKTKFLSTTGILQSFRRQKEGDELRLLRRAHRMTKELLRRVPSVLRKNITEEQLARQLLQWALELGAEGLSFDPIVAFGTHTACPHHRPTSRTLQKGHIVQIDVGVKYKGYCADMSEVFFTVTPTKTEAQVYRALQVAQRNAIRAVRHGASNRELDRIARSILKKAGIEQYFTHSLGHGVGLEIHEGVSLSQKASEDTVLRNEVITIEPGVYFPGKFGMRVEDMIYVQ